MTDIVEYDFPANDLGLEDDTNLPEIDETGGRALATVRRIISLDPIPGADKIEVATVDGWEVVVAKEVGHKVGDLVVYFEIDSLLPIREEFEFLRERCYVKNSLHGEGFRLRTIKLRKQISQGMILPLEKYSMERGEDEDYVEYFIKLGTSNPEWSVEQAFGGTKWYGSSEEYFARDKDTEISLIFAKEGDDVTKLLGVKKYEKILATNLAGIARGNFPSFIPKTDEDRIQNRYRKIENLINDGEIPDEWEQTIKLDGTSFTAYLKDDVFGVCSRNLDLKETEENLYWQVARKYKIEEILRGQNRNLAIQGEIVGPGIQSSYEKFTENELFVFNVYDIEQGAYLSAHDRRSICERYSLNSAPVLPEVKFKDFADVKAILAHAEGRSIKQDVREGVVWKNKGNPYISFKAISQKYLLNETHD